MSRANVAVKVPPVNLNLNGFPTESSGDRVYYRAHKATRGAWYFGNAMTSRFDIENPDGTLYLGDDIETAIRESFGEVLVDAIDISHAMANTIGVSSVRLPRQYECAAVAHKSAARFGLTREINTTIDYDVTQAWARRFHAEGLQGIHYESRYTTAEGASSWALFGPSGVDPTFVTLVTLAGHDAVAETDIHWRTPPSRDQILFNR